MPNHIHVLVQQNSDLSNVVRVLKGGAAYIVNEVLERKGAVWSRDYYDKIVRDERHYRVVYEHIKYNAFKAGLEDAKERFYGKYG
jgi:REP element-mobilizing transposase RayT